MSQIPKRRLVRTSENAIQKSVFQHLRTRGVPGLFAFHPMNGGVHQRGRARAIHTGLGVVAGVPDVCLIHDGRFYALELKTEDGRVSEEQLAAIDNIRVAGGYSCIAYGLDRALRVLEGWGLLKGRAA